MKETIDINKHCVNIRKRIAQYGYLSGRGHISSALSCVEILAALYCTGIVDVSKILNESENRDRIILSKAHAGLGLFSTLIECGAVEESVLTDFCSINGKLATHPELGTIRGVERTGGSLGQGLNFACGVSFALKQQKHKAKVYVLVGDGELQEGSIWEALLFAGHHQLDNLTIIIDNNRRQISGKTDQILSVIPLKEKMVSFNLKTIEVNGHSIEQLIDAYQMPFDGRTKVVIANTLKGKGISFIEDQPGWHGKGLSQEQYNQAFEELEDDKYISRNFK